MSAELRIRYSCKVCGLKDIEIQIPFRDSNEDVVKWMESKVIPATGADHRRRSPLCMTQELSDLKIPITGAEYVGGPCVN